MQSIEMSKQLQQIFAFLLRGTLAGGWPSLCVQVVIARRMPRLRDDAVRLETEPKRWACALVSRLQSGYSRSHILSQTPAGVAAPSRAVNAISQ
jgi:hypothetical protein